MAKYSLIITLLLMALWPGASLPQNSPPSISIIIDDLGDNWARDLQVVKLPGAVTVSILPHTDNDHSIAKAAQAHGKDVLLHLPMQPRGDKHPGPGVIKVSMNHSNLINTLQGDFAAIPGIVGFNNHMGSLFTENASLMLQVMRVAREQGMRLFVDSRTSADSVAAVMASATGLANTSRDIFLDNRPELVHIHRQFQQLIALAKKRGHALAIGHPHPATIEYLNHWIPRLQQLGVKLIPISHYVAQYSQGGTEHWQASLSHSPSLAKNWKP